MTDDLVTAATGVTVSEDVELAYLRSRLPNLPGWIQAWQYHRWFTVIKEEIR